MPKGKVHSDAKLTYGFVEIYVIEKVMSSQKNYDVITF